jgi:type IV pilus assembly protein PilM
MPLFSSRRLSPIGIDIGTRNIKAAQLELGGERGRVVALAQHVLPINLESAADRAEAVRAGLSNLQRMGIFKGRDVVLSLNAQQLFVQNVRVPRLPDEELHKVVRWEAEERLPEDFGEAEIRYLVAGDVRAPSSSGEGSEIRREVIVLACRRKEIQESIALLESLRLRPVAIDVSALAMARTCQSMLRRKADEQSAFLFIDLGAGMSTAVVTRGHEILLIKQLPSAGQSMDRAVARKLRLSIEDAAMARQQWGSKDDSVIDPDLGRVVGEAVRSEIETMAGELLMCVRYHSVTFRGNRITKALLLGGESNTRIADQLASRIDIPCEVCDPFTSVDVSPHVADQLRSSQPGQWVVALGLCTKSSHALAA